MAREIVIWCDIHLEHDERVPADEFTIAINGARPKTVGLCGVCQGDVLKALEGVLDAHGVTSAAANTTPTKRVRASHGPGAAPDTCLVCGKAVKMTAGAMGNHLRREHQTVISRVYGNNCPLCAKGFGNLGTHIGRAHPNVRHGIAEAFMVAALEGDKHGIVAERRQEAGG